MGLGVKHEQVSEHTRLLLVTTAGLSWEFLGRKVEVFLGTSTKVYKVHICP